MIEACPPPPTAPLLKIVGTVLLAYLGYDFMFYWLVTWLVD